jgi:hypothetical protein
MPIPSRNHSSCTEPQNSLPTYSQTWCYLHKPPSRVHPLGGRDLDDGSLNKLPGLHIHVFSKVEAGGHGRRMGLSSTWHSQILGWTFWCVPKVKVNSNPLQAPPPGHKLHERSLLVLCLAHEPQKLHSCYWFSAEMNDFFLSSSLAVSPSTWRMLKEWMSCECHCM